MPVPQNIVGSRIKALRREKGLTQAMLAARCARFGWDIGENVITKIETHVRCVTDFEFVCLAHALGTSAESLLPASDKRRMVITGFFSKRTGE